MQYQGINQGFRVIGGKTKIEGVITRAFRLNTHPYSLEQLNEYIPEDKRIDESKLWKESRLTLEQAKKKYPEWYEKRVERGERKGKWKCKEDLYHWWIRQIKEGANVGHRYFCIMCLAIYGVKSGVSEEQVKKDALELMPFLDSMSTTEPFGENDVVSALDCFDERYATFPIKDIIKISGITIKKNDRNWRKRTEHLQADYWTNEKDRPEVNPCKQNRELALKFMRDNGEIKGRPQGSSKEKEIVRAWREQNPTGRKADCHRETELDPKTIRKWWE